ncbi:hypothetical protein NQZ68_025821 [Dissostichus eleginoides]|nr:hypothetical protein NQZ68_025821 [Dissostichus eleginoides]
MVILPTAALLPLLRPNSQSPLSDPKYISQSPYWVLRFVRSSSHYGTRLTERLQFLGTLF